MNRDNIKLARDLEAVATLIGSGAFSPKQADGTLRSIARHLRDDAPHATPLVIGVDSASGPDRTVYNFAHLGSLLPRVFHKKPKPPADKPKIDVDMTYSVCCLQHGPQRIAFEIGGRQYVFDRRGAQDDPERESIDNFHRRVRDTFSNDVQVFNVISELLSEALGAFNKAKAAQAATKG